ncbi:hypothetical protein [Colwellia sp. RSH04]|uniref:hypothetical protein n=1 Tax=Colwellia sp. RSH04 TaxID=2305464 RepID=UPI000E5771BC|nr:hypothetical protein [Colwellia sp. RSH04]RHW77985.1 hypothetical protein D1094_03425 [Colwellia sp. RSH04]
MQSIKFIYLYFCSGVLFLITAGAYYPTENSHLTPVFACIGFAIISISFVLLSTRKRKNKK